MKEIDFLPEWYKSDKRRQLSRRTQYIALGCIFVTIMAWSLIGRHSVSIAQARLTQSASEQTRAQDNISAFNETRNKVTELQAQADVLEKIDAKINVGNVLAELGFLIDKNIILGRVELSAERIANQQGKKRNARYRPAASGLLGDVRFKVVISGIASEASVVAALICQIEESPYFRQVYPSYSRNTKGKAPTGLAVENLQVTEFEICCYLANYREQ